jgi:hypothetical protein
LQVTLGLAYTVGQAIIIAYDINNYQECNVISYNSSTGALEFDAPSTTIGGGTYSSWQINLNGATGGAG